jgi:hypothetical protein
MRLVVRDSEFTLDHGGAAGAGPHLASKAIRLSAVGQQLRYQGTPRFVELGRPTCVRARVQGRDTSSSHRFQPLADCAFGDAQRFGDIVLRPACALERICPQASGFLPIAGVCICCHTPCLTRLTEFSKSCNGQ